MYNKRVPCVDRSNGVMHSTCPTSMDPMGDMLYIADGCNDACIDLMWEYILLTGSVSLAM